MFVAKDAPELRLATAGVEPAASTEVALYPITLDLRPARAKLAN
jgi:hypothetical protein